MGWLGTTQPPQAPVSEGNEQPVQANSIIQRHTDACLQGASDTRLPQRDTAVPGCPSLPPPSGDTAVTYLLVFLGHPLVPVVEHIQPLGLPLPEHLQGHLLQPVGPGGRGRSVGAWPSAEPPWPPEHPGCPPRPGGCTPQGAGLSSGHARQHQHFGSCWKRSPPVSEVTVPAQQLKPLGSSLHCTHHVLQHPQGQARKVSKEQGPEPCRRGRLHTEKAGAVSIVSSTQPRPR